MTFGSRRIRDTRLLTENRTATFPYYNAFPSSGGNRTVTVLDSAGNSTLTLSGGVLSAPGSLGSSLRVSGNTITVTTTSADDVNIEVITVSGIRIAASSTAAVGPVQAILSGTLADAVTVGGQYTLASPGMVTSRAACMDRGWQTLVRANGTAFKNVGDCIKYVSTGK